jgi:hypothetical protein
MSGISSEDPTQENQLVGLAEKWNKLSPEVQGVICALLDALAEVGEQADQ